VDRTGLGKGTVSRIAKEWEGDKENSQTGRPAKLSTRSKQAIIREINSGRIDNAVEAAQFINPTLPTPVHPETIRKALKEAGYIAVVKKKVPLLKKVHREKRLEFARYHQNWTVEDFKRVLWTDETKINRIGSDGKVYVWKLRGEPVSDRTSTPTVKHGGGNNLMVWGCMGWNGVGKLIEVQERWMLINMCKFWRMELLKALRNWRWRRMSVIFSKTMTQSTLQKRPLNGLKTIILKYYHGLLNLLT